MLNRFQRYALRASERHGLGLVVAGNWVRTPNGGKVMTYSGITTLIIARGNETND